VLAGSLALGYGRFGGSNTINEFTYLQTVTINHDQHFAL
jgi:hypothetical protein